MITVGITGTIGAGKGTVVEYLKTKGFTHYSVRDFLLKEIQKRGMEPVRDSMFIVANDFRKISPGYIMEHLLLERKDNSGNAVIESQRALGEINVLRNHDKNFRLFAVDADQRVRYERILARKLSTDNVTFEKFIEDENKELENTEPWKTNLKACIAEADYLFNNNGSVQDLFSQIDDTLHHILA